MPERGAARQAWSIERQPKSRLPIGSHSGRYPPFAQNGKPLWRQCCHPQEDEIGYDRAARDSLLRRYLRECGRAFAIDSRPERSGSPSLGRRGIASPSCRFRLRRTDPTRSRGQPEAGPYFAWAWHLRREHLPAGRPGYCRVGKAQSAAARNRIARVRDPLWIILPRLQPGSDWNCTTNTCWHTRAMQHGGRHHRIRVQVVRPAGISAPNVDWRAGYRADPITRRSVARRDESITNPRVRDHGLTQR